MSTLRQDKEIEQFRTLLDIPGEFKNGFGWMTVVGLLFCGTVMIPGSIYMALMTGGDLGTAASWVTVILFMEIARRSIKPLNKQQLVVLLHAANVMMIGSVIFPGGPVANLVYRAYLVTGDAVRDAGMTGIFPSWFAPAPDSPAITERNLFHPDWLIPIAILVFVVAINFVQKYSLGYFFFRLTSDVERLPFPRAPIQAQGAMALAEADESKEDEEKPKSMRWRIFTLGAYIGIAFGFIIIGVPSLTSVFLAQPVFIIPQPFVDTTTLTEGLLPATPTGITLDAGLFLLGFILPFWAVMGTALAVLLTLVLNPLMQKTGILETWQPGMDTVNTTFANNVDFWLSFQIGAGFGIAAVSVFSLFRDFASHRKENRERVARGELAEDPWALPREGRGDYPVWIGLVAYSITAILNIILIVWLLPWHAGVFFFVVFFAFVYSPFISYVSARLIGISGQRVDIPFIRQLSFLLAGAKGVEIWLAPIPLENESGSAQAYRVTELTGTTFWSIIKTDLIGLPILFALSLLFWAFIWKSDPIPSELFPTAQVQWELQTKNQVLVFSSTTGERDFGDSQLAKSLKPWVIATGFGVVTVGFSMLSSLGLPVLLVYGFVRGFGQFPHTRILEVAGAVFARYYLHKKYGTKNFLRAAPTLLAGYLTGVGLISMATIAFKLVSEAVSAAPF